MVRHAEKHDPATPESTPAASYERDGFAVLNLLDDDQSAAVESFARGWLDRLLEPWRGGDEEKYPLETYHRWCDQLGVEHAGVFKAANRHTIPGRDATDALLNERLEAFLHSTGCHAYRTWDEGLGWLAFRFIRPGRGDGYPMTRKEWGIAKNVVSFWVPIIGRSPRETITLVPGSHLHDYESYLPEDTKFRKDELRLSDNYTDLVLYRPDLKPGQVIAFHPRTLHSENVENSDITRLNLEFRIDPVR